MIYMQSRVRDGDAVRWADGAFQTRLLDSVQQAVVVTDLDGTISYWNRFAETLYGWTADDVVGRNVLDVTPSETTLEHAEAIMTTIATGQSWTGESLVRRRDGTSFWAEVSATPIFEDGLPVGTIGITTDITERKQAEAALRESEERFRSAFDDAETGQAIVGFDGRFLRVNASLCAMVGYTADDLTGMNYRDVTHPDDIDIIEALDGDSTVGTILPTFSFEKRYIHKDGHHPWVQVTSSVVHDEHGQPLYRTSQILDITERKLAEERDRLLARISSTLQESLDPETTLTQLVTVLLPSVADWCSVGLVEDDGSLRRVAVVHVDPAKASLATELMQFPLDRDSSFGLPAAIRSGQSIIDTNVRIEAWRATLSPDYGRVHQALGNTAQMHVPLVVRGRVIGGIAFIVGDSGRRYTEADVPFVEEVARRAALAIDNARLHHDLRQSEATYRRLIERIPAAIYIEPLDVAIGTTPTPFISPQIEQITGYAVEHWQTTPNFSDQIVHPDDRARRMDEIIRTDATGDPYRCEYRIIHRAGHTVWVLNEAVLVHDDDGVPLFWHGLLTDITERKQADDALRESERRLRDVVENIPATTYTYVVGSTTEQTTMDISPQIQRMLGYDPQLLRTWHAWRACIHPDDRALISAESIRTDQTGDLYDVTYRMTTADGRLRWVRDVAVRTEQTAGHPDIWQGFLFDITDEHIAQERKSAMLIGALDAVITITSDGEVVDWNPAAESLFGYRRDDAVGRALVDLIIPDDLRDAHRTGMHRYAETGIATLLGQRVEMTARRADGTAFPIELAIIRIESDGLPLFTGFIRDISERKQAEDALRESENRFRGLIQYADDMVGILDVSGIIRYQSPAIERWLGYRPEELVGRHCTDGLHPDDRDAMTALLAEVNSDQDMHRSITYRCRHSDGSWRWLDATVTNLLDVPGIEGIVVNAHDVTDRIRADAAIRTSEERFRSAFDDAAIGMAIQALDSTFLRVNPALCVMTGYEETELIGQRGAVLSHPDDVDVALPFLDLITRGETSTFMIEKRYRHKDGHTIWVFLSAGTVRDADGTPLHTITQVQDISAQKELQAVLIKQALHDQLTGLPSRVLLLDRTARALAQVERHDRNVAVLFLDLDNFKYVNDSLGHAIGDDLLIQVASRLSGCLREGDTASRLGGDEFAILLPEVANAAGAVDVAQRALDCLSTPFMLAGRDITVTVSVGIALNGASADDLLCHADVAMYRAKAKGKSQYAVFDTIMHASILQRLELEHDLRRAIDDEQFTLVYQPIISLGTGETVGMEALVRWQHPVRGVVYPADFIPIAEQTGLIVPLGYWVLTEATRQMAAWNQSLPGDQQLSISVNLSPRQFHQPNLVLQVETILSDMGLDPKHLVVEITESVVMDDGEEAVEQLHALKALGVEISIDDFGTGYSSLAYLQRFPVDVIKIDRSFVAKLGAPDEATAIVTAIISMAHALRIRVVAEGVETREQMEQLKQLGCERGQGYYFAKPLPATMAFRPPQLG